MRYSNSDYSLTAAHKGWGRGWPTCDARSQTAVVTAPISGVSVVVHKRIARLVFLLLAATEAQGYLLRAGQCWGGNCRPIAGTSVPSNHSWWLAVDINSLANPYVLKVKGAPVTDMPKWLSKLWNSFGFAWGGDYSGSKADAMHLEFMGSPEDADEMTALAEQRLANFNPQEELDVSAKDELWNAIVPRLDEMRGELDQLMARLPAIDSMHVGLMDPTAGVRNIVLGLAGREPVDVDASELAGALAPILAPGLAAAVANKVDGLDEDEALAIVKQGIRAVLGGLDTAS